MRLWEGLADYLWDIFKVALQTLDVLSMVTLKVYSAHDSVNRHTVDCYINLSIKTAPGVSRTKLTYKNRRDKGEQKFQKLCGF